MVFCDFVLLLSGSLPSPTQSENEKEFLGDGKWPVGQASPVSPQSYTIPPPPTESVDHATKMVYKMSSRPRGMGMLISVMVENSSHEL